MRGELFGVFFSPDFSTRTTLRNVLFARRSFPEGGALLSIHWMPAAPVDVPRGSKKDSSPPLLGTAPTGQNCCSREWQMQLEVAVAPDGQR